MIFNLQTHFTHESTNKSFTYCLNNKPEFSRLRSVGYKNLVWKFKQRLEQFG